MNVDPIEILKTVCVILVVDWPTKDVPESLVRSGFQVVVRGGPGPEDYWDYELNNGSVVKRQVGRLPDHADLIYSYRPLRELPGIIATAKGLHAHTIWTQSGLSAAGVSDPKGCWLPEDELGVARELVQSAGLNHASQPYIGEAVTKIRGSCR